jgi:Ca2+-binding EF-hand superfamily protein
MVRLWTTLLALAVGMAVGSNVALAKKEKKDGEKKPAKAEELFKKLDKNGDGKLSKEEFSAHGKDPKKAEAHFDKIDTDRNGSISPDEFKAFLKKMEERAKKKKEQGSDKKPQK